MEVNEVLNNGATVKAPTSDAGKSPSDLESQKAKVMALMGGGSVDTNSQGILNNLAGGNANVSAGGSAMPLGIGVG